MILNDEQLEQIRQGMEKGVAVPQTVKGMGLDITPQDVRQQLRAKYGNEAIDELVKVIRKNIQGDRVAERVSMITKALKNGRIPASDELRKAVTELKHTVDDL